ncbi:diheme cytochrome c [uncultured Gammaproteobacteria bacterium]|jgi:hypothetical protein|uniref:diheme cytochrome c n=1 Tax=thiotrophic endosymbiont of Bathymodiolus puteoserpentis (Logatchev) TaxID=343240 RepID=UPI0010B76F20|nr:diheme cytochrome c [thiotrophic endosymbiont of Bathymodiolus puteoserpentis (Logatchev)]CAC9586121.1 diheme cytochrome c [uncultured Gammaproteobacteria bacterium]CAC9657173.1 diheme cytochrome c [uncultured Gammaproteobacteria bacterium]CAC9663382.1 diheme cytochrome c [uncultured Gammaproteobacteria bacterium]CAC9964034.1 diheme cytochrome c [uncultured Gammaproteobacteria bacterium]SSC09482.1 lipoprotein, putative [thiotrophic endosymbiont of Bathymodiolus puteoserpentis (Logatchev)]
MYKKYLILMLLFISSFYSLYTQADDEGFSSFFNSFFGKELDVAPVKNALYLEECGACHFAYQPGLLPSRSWKKMLSQQEAKNHFEEDITFDDKTVEAQLMHYLTSNAAEYSSFKRSRKIMRSLSNNASPLQISETPYIKRKHAEIPKKLIIQPEVGSIANCEACHKKASKGNYDDDEVSIPNAWGYSWD